MTPRALSNAGRGTGMVWSDRAYRIALPIRESRRIAEDPHRRPVTARAERHVRGNGLPPLSGPCLGVAKPPAPVPTVVEGEEAPRAIRAACYESLGPSTNHVATTDDAVHRERDQRLTGPRDLEHVPSLARSGPNDGVAKPDRRPIERRDDKGGRRRTSSPPMGGPTPGRELLGVTAGAALGTDKVCVRYLSR